MTQELEDVLARALVLMGRPKDILILAPLVERELLYRLLSGPRGKLLRQIASAKGPLPKVRKAIGWIGQNFDRPFKVDDVGAACGMSRASLNRSFREITGLSPLQYQKQLRLLEARRLLIGGEHNVSDVVRGVPLIMFIFWVHFFVPLLIGRTVSGFTTILVTLVIYEAAYLAEVVRAGIEGLPKGQTEAARAVGLSYMQTILKVILPQALYSMVPAMISQFVSTIKETSLGYVISVNELTFAANQIQQHVADQALRGLFAAGDHLLFAVFLPDAVRTLDGAAHHSQACWFRRCAQRTSSHANRRAGAPLILSFKNGTAP